MQAPARDYVDQDVLSLAVPILPCWWHPGSAWSAAAKGRRNGVQSAHARMPCLQGQASTGIYVVALPQQHIPGLQQQRCGVSLAPRPGR